MTDFSNIIKALEEYEKRKPLVEKAFNDVVDNKTAQIWIRMEDEETHKVRLAFYEDTKHINSLAGCMCLSVDDAKKIVARATAAVSESKS